MNFLLESPVWVAMIGCGLAAVTGYAWTQVGRKELLYAALAILVITVLMTVVSLQVLTPTERLIKTLDELALALEENDLGVIDNHIDVNATESVQQAREQLDAITFDKARIRRIKRIQIDSDAVPPTAIAEFNVATKLNYRGQSLDFPRFVKLYFVQRDAGWRVRDFEHFEAIAGFQE